VPDEIRELLISETATEKLGVREISKEEATQLVDNRYVIAPNGGRRRRGARKTGSRRLMIGRSDGGRPLTLVVERTLDPTTWLVVTGWNSSKRERKMLAKKG
jgi:hypothetical protein